MNLTLFSKKKKKGKIKLNQGNQRKEIRLPRARRAGGGIRRGAILLSIR